MSDFITGLRGDLVDAADRHRRSSRVGTATRRLVVLPRVWRPALAAATVAASVFAALVVASALSPSRPAARPEIAAVVQLGGQPRDAVVADGALWVSDFSGRVLRVDPGRRAVTARIDVDGNPEGIAAGAGALWVVSPDAYRDGRDSLLSRIDPRTGDVERNRVPGYVMGLAVGAGGVWLLDWHNPLLQRIDPASHGRTATVEVPRAVVAVAVGGDRTLWALGPQGTVVSIDGNSLAVQRVPRVAGTWGAGFENALDADAEGAWVANRQADMLLRIEAGRVVSRIPVGADPGPVAVGDGAVWVAYGDRAALRGNYRLARIDPETDAVAATVDLGRHPPTALLVAGDDVWVIAADGTALLVQPRDD
jgi:virginiamycin B lyase